MARSSREQASKNREKILDRASRLFRQFSVDSVSIAEVMSAADMTTGGFYKHFESKDALIAEVLALSFKQTSTSWHRVTERRHEGLRAGAIVKYYLQKKPSDQACPMLAFAPHIMTETTKNSARDAYRRGTKALFSQFLDNMSSSRTGDDAACVRQARVLFAAMVGARFLAQSMDDEDWKRSVQAAVEAESAQRPAAKPSATFTSAPSRSPGQ